jgi:hypothetical protein
MSRKQGAAKEPNKCQENGKQQEKSQGVSDISLLQ